MYLQIYIYVYIIHCIIYSVKCPGNTYQFKNRYIYKYIYISIMGKYPITDPLLIPTPLVSK